jgi:hypothetical protein
MIKPRNHSAKAAALTESQKVESSYLNRNAPTFGREAPDDYAARAKAFNAEMRAIGAISHLVVES